MKFKALLVASSLLLASTAFAATYTTYADSIHFTIYNETGAPIHGLTVMPGITNMAPTQLVASTLPAGKTDLVFDVVKKGQIGGVALVAQGGDLQISAGDDLTQSCQSEGTLGASCYGALNDHNGVYHVTATVIKN